MKKRIIATALAVAVLSVPSLFAKDSETYVTQEINAPDRCLPTFYEALKARMTFSLGWKDGANPAAWKKAGLEKARELIIQNEDDTPFDMVVIDREKRDGYTAQKVVFNISKESRVLAYLLVPNGKKNQKFPAALMLHDHGSNFRIGKEKMVRPFGKTDQDKERLKLTQDWAKTYFSGQFPGDVLAKRGYVVLSFDAFGWGDRSVKGFGTNSQQSLASNLFNMGTSFAGIIAQEDCRAAKLLASLPEVDPAKVACIGFSMGGFRAWQLAAISDDISAGISVCWIGTMKDHIVADDGQLKGNSAFSMLHPTIAKYLDYPDVAGLAAPKAMYFISGDRDGVNPVEGTNNAYAKMRKIWQANGADDKLVTTMNAGLTHSFPEEQQKLAFDWLDTVFK